MSAMQQRLRWATLGLTLALLGATFPAAVQAQPRAYPHGYYRDDPNLTPAPNPYVSPRYAPSYPRSDYQGPEHMVEKWYRQYLGRDVDPQGVQFWGYKLRNGYTPHDALAGILGSDEYYKRKGNTNEFFVRGLYHDVLGRHPNPQEMQDARSRLNVDYLDVQRARFELAQNILAQRQ